MPTKKPRSRVSKIEVRIPDETIAVRAYERWMGRGCPISDGVEDWLAAQKELETELTTAAKGKSAAAASIN